MDMMKVLLFKNVHCHPSFGIVEVLEAQVGAFPLKHQGFKDLPI
jgi:hypothetical protein